MAHSLRFVLTFALAPLVLIGCGGANEQVIVHDCVDAGTDEKTKNGKEVVYPLKGDFSSISWTFTMRHYTQAQGPAFGPSRSRAHSIRTENVRFKCGFNEVKDKSKFIMTIRYH